MKRNNYNALCRRITEQRIPSADVGYAVGKGISANLVENIRLYYSGRFAEFQNKESSRILSVLETLAIGKGTGSGLADLLSSARRETGTQVNTMTCIYDGFNFMALHSLDEVCSMLAKSLMVLRKPLHPKLEPYQVAKPDKARQKYLRLLGNLKSRIQSHYGMLFQ